MKIGPLELSQLRSDVAEVRGDVRDLSSQVSELFLHTMSPLMYVNLEKLNSASFGRFEKTQGLERELRTLRDLAHPE